MAMTFSDHWWSSLIFGQLQNHSKARNAFATPVLIKRKQPQLLRARVVRTYDCSISNPNIQQLTVQTKPVLNKLTTTNQTKLEAKPNGDVSQDNSEIEMKNTSPAKRLPKTTFNTDIRNQTRHQALKHFPKRTLHK